MTIQFTTLSSKTDYFKQLPPSFLGIRSFLMNNLVHEPFFYKLYLSQNSFSEKSMKQSLFIFLILNSLSAFAFEGKVIYLKGRSTVLHPHHMDSSELKQSDELVADTSIVTYENSIVKIVMDEDSVMTIWPNSKVKISQFINKKKNLPGIVMLQTGQASFTVRKEPKISGYKSKLILSTHRAAMATRNATKSNGDTEIMASYDSANETTSVVAFLGDVTVARSNESINSNVDLIGDVLNRSGHVVTPNEYAVLPATDSEKESFGKLSANQIAAFRNGEPLQLAGSKPKDPPVVAQKNASETEAKPESQAPSSHEKNWYAGAGLGIAKSSIDTINIKQELSSRSMAGDGKVHDKSRLAGKIYVGYELTKYFATELSFVHLGKSSTELNNVTPANASRLGNIYSIAGKGPALTLKINGEITKDLRIFAKAGVIHWRAKYFNYTSAREEKIKATEFTYGYGLDYKLPNSYISGLKIRLDYDFFQMRDNSTHLITTGFTAPF